MEVESLKLFYFEFRTANGQVTWMIGIGQWIMKFPQDISWLVPIPSMIIIRSKYLMGVCSRQFCCPGFPSRPGQAYIFHTISFRVWPLKKGGIEKNHSPHHCVFCSQGQKMEVPNLPTLIRRERPTFTWSQDRHEQKPRMNRFFLIQKYWGCQRFLEESKDSVSSLNILILLLI